jgi:hypothetical protein
VMPCVVSFTTIVPEPPRVTEFVARTHRLVNAVVPSSLVRHRIDAVTRRSADRPGMIDRRLSRDRAL